MFKRSTTSLHSWSMFNYHTSLPECNPNSRVQPFVHINTPPGNLDCFTVLKHTTQRYFWCFRNPGKNHLGWPKRKVTKKIHKINHTLPTLTGWPDFWTIPRGSRALLNWQWPGKLLTLAVVKDEIIGIIMSCPARICLKKRGVQSKFMNLISSILYNIYNRLLNIAKLFRCKSLKKLQDLQILVFF